MSRTLLKVAGEQNDPLRVKIFPHDFVDKPLLSLILLQKCIVYRGNRLLSRADGGERQ